MAKRLVSRRNFLRNMSCAAVGTTTLMNTLTNLKFINSAAALNGFTDYKAMVVLLMGGGNDAYNMLIPYDDVSHAEYSVTRSNLALPKIDLDDDASKNLRSLNYTDAAGKEFAVHHAMSNMEMMFKDGNLSFVTNVGTLVEPTTKAQVYDGSTQLPLGLYSHSDQIMHWQTALPQERVAQGWGGKIADMFNACNDNENISLNLSFAGSNVYQTGQNTVEFSLNTPRDNNDLGGATELNGYSAPWEVPTANRNTIDSMIDKYYDDVFKKTYVDIMKVGKYGAEEYNTAIEAQVLTTEFSENRLSQQFKLVARTIAARETLGMKRQIFFIEFGGFDMHDEVLETHDVLLSEIDTALGEFNAAMDELLTQDMVTTFSLSEFARTLTSNGQGSDHAWGSNAFIMGGAVNGGEIFGTYPDLDLNNNLELGGGVLIPTIATDQYFGDIASWFGVENDDLLTLFPNIDNFDSIYNGNPLGLLI